MDKLTFRQKLNSYLLDELRINRNSIYLSTDSRELTENLGFDAQIPSERLIELAQGEEANMGAAAGLLNEGFDVYMSLKSSKYLIRSLDSLINYLAKYNALGMKSKGSFSLLVPVGYRPYTSMAESETPEALLAHYPGLDVVYPSNADDLVEMIKGSVASHGVMVALLDVALLDREAEKDAPQSGDFGARVLREGTDVTVITYGSLVKNAMKTAKMAEMNDASVEVIDLRTISPLDRNTIIKSVCRTGRAVVMYKDYRQFSVGSEIAAMIVESEAFDYLEAPVKRISYKGNMMTYSPDTTRKEMPHSGELLQAVLDLKSY